MALSGDGQEDLNRIIMNRVSESQKQLLRDKSAPGDTPTISTIISQKYPKILLNETDLLRTQDMKYIKPYQSIISKA